VYFRFELERKKGEKELLIYFYFSKFGEASTRARRSLAQIGGITLETQSETCTATTVE
jgi:hypothetical protein